MTVINTESGYRLKSGPTAEITGQDILWTGGPTTFNVVNEAPEVSSTQAKVTCVWEPYGGGPGLGPRPPDINGQATGTAQLKVAHIEWGAMTPLVQAADGTSAIAWEVKLVDDNGSLVSGVSVNFALSAGNGAWHLSPASGPGTDLVGTVTSTEGSRGSLQVNYTYFGHAKSSTSGQITFVGVEKLQYQIGSTSWADMPNPLVVSNGTTVDFKAIPKPSDASWPSGKPVWSGAGGSGDQASQTFNTPGTNIVTVECGNVVTGKVISIMVVITPSGDTIDGNNSGQFTVSVQPYGVQVDSYQWTWQAPEGAGNNPQVNYATSNQKSNVVNNAHWFALPDNRLASATGWDCEYTINCTVTVNGVQCVDSTPPTWIVYLPVPPAVTSWPQLEGMVTIGVRQVGGSNEWYVSGIGTLSRTAPQVTSYIPAASQFYNKVVTVHEGRHVTQWTSMNPWQSLFNATDLYNNVLSGMTSKVSEQDLTNQIQAQIDARILIDGDTAANTAIDRERDAFQQSNAVEPNYLEVDIP